MPHQFGGQWTLDKLDALKRYLQFDADERLEQTREGNGRSRTG